ncbi:MAG: hypothetical protein KBS74_00760 [Clostridiales bacterium]|nr:hypothetical protein [Candidatus Cacconaster stercorequi]
MTLSERQEAILDGSAENVTSKELKSFMRNAHLYGLTDVVSKLREQYWRIMDDPLSRLCQKLNISPSDHTIVCGRENGLNISCYGVQCFWVDGYPDYVYELLFTDNSSTCATVKSVTRAEKFLKKAGNNEALCLLYVKCAETFAERARMQQKREQNILERNGLPADTEYSTISWDYIDGLTFPQWKLLNVPGYRLLKEFSYFKMIEHFTQEGDLDMVKDIESRYEQMMHDREQNILEKNGLPADTEYAAISWASIDGLTFSQWKMLNMLEYSLSSKTSYSKMINHFVEKGDAAKADIIKNKYKEYIKRITPPPVFPTMSEEEALQLYQYIFSYEFRQQLIESNKKEGQKHEIHP